MEKDKDTVVEENVNSEKLSRRDFARTSVVAGAAAVGLPSVLGAETGSTEKSAPSKASATTGKKTAPKGTEEWREGLTIPAEYYLDEEHYKHDERYIAENFWLLADHVSRIPEPGDFFVFKFGLGESAIVVRNESNEIRAFHNVCRHRGSRLCRHDEDPRPNDDRLSVRQLGESGKAQVFRCPYHAWLYDLDGSLIDAYDMPDDFDMAANSLINCHMKIVAGNIFLNFSRAEEPPEWGVLGYNSVISQMDESHSLTDLKIGARRAYPIRANWKLAIENFLECYHCGPAHTNLVTSHFWDYTLTASQKKRRADQIAALLGEDSSGYQGTGNGTGPFDGELNPQYLTGSVDGKPLAPLLPNFKEWTNDTFAMATDWDTGYWQAYDDHVVVIRFTPRGPELTDAEAWWLVHPDAVEGKDYDPEKLMALWDITIIEDAWIVENNHLGIKSAGYTPGRYSPDEIDCADFIAWYMRDVIKA